MVVEPGLELPMDKIAAFAERWQIREIALFGSVLREDFRADSDVDLLVTLDPAAHHGLFALARMHDEMEAILGRPVDLVPKDAVLESANTSRRERILASSRLVYAA